MCGKPSHFFYRGYHRFNRNFQRSFNSFGKESGGTSQSNSQAFIASSQESNRGYLTDLEFQSGTPYGHVSQPFDSSSQYSQPYPHSNQFGDSSWYVDSGATNHITSSLNNLSLHSPYNGTDKVVAGNGKTLPISNVGLSQMLTHTTPISVLSLLNVLHVPSMTKNLISVSTY